MATETLRPNAAGDETAIRRQYPSSGAHWDKVDEAVSDDSSTYVFENGSTWRRDLYNLPSSAVGAGTINSVTVWMRALTSAGDLCGAKISLKTGVTTVDGAAESFAFDWTWYNFSKVWTLNPVTGLAWTWTQINALQIGCRLLGDDDYDEVDVTQIYVVVDYTAVASGWTGTFNELKTPASAVDIASASLASVIGVTG
jgi:hypothetical protein